MISPNYGVGTMVVIGGYDKIAEFRENSNDAPSTSLHEYLQVEGNTTIGGSINVGGNITFKGTTIVYANVIRWISFGQIHCFEVRIFE